MSYFTEVNYLYMVWMIVNTSNLVWGILCEVPMWKNVLKYDILRL